MIRRQSSINKMPETNLMRTDEALTSGKKLFRINTKSGVV